MNPSMHITKSSFKQLLKDCSVKLTDSKIDLIFSKSINYNIKNRYIISSNKQSIIEKLLKTHKRDCQGVELFNNVLSSVRKAENHSYVRFIGKDSPQYSILKEINLIAIEFCEVFDLPQRQGFTEFVKYGLKIIGKNYALNKFKYYKDKIFKYKEVELLVGSDSDKYLTSQIYSYYSERVEKETSVNFEVNTIDEYADFIYTRQSIMDCNADYRLWIDSQFDQLSFLEVVPTTSQLHGENALKRYKKSNLKVKKNVVDESESILNWLK